MEINVLEYTQLSRDIPMVKTEDPTCKEEIEVLLKKSTCSAHFTGNTNKSGQACIFESGDLDEPVLGLNNSKFTIVMVTDEGSQVVNAFLDGDIKYVTETTGVETGSTYILSASIRARTADGSKEISLNWP